MNEIIIKEGTRNIPTLVSTIFINQYLIALLETNNICIYGDK